MGPKIGSGSFGEVYLVNLFGTEEVYALKKVQNCLLQEDDKSKQLQLLAEGKILKNIEGGVGFPKVYWTGN